MPRILCFIGLVMAGLVFLLFFVDLIMTVAGMGSLFRFPSLLMDIVFVVCSAALGYISWTTLKEQK